jgi:hypothetical protein
MAGSWVSLPTNCTRSLSLTFLRCAAFGELIRTKCVAWANDIEQKCATWADQGHSACASWSDRGHRQCCTWWPCSWFCDAFYWVANWVCDAFYWVANWVCILFTTIVKVVCTATALVVETFCLLWTLLSVVFCLSRANGGTAFLLTDGIVLVQECQFGYGTRRWWKLAPDANGSYRSGSWQRAADSHVGRKYFGSAVLADGRVLVCGGEYSDASGVDANDESNRCEIYDPVANAWTEFGPPNDSNGRPWGSIGDAACALLSDGTFLTGNAVNGQTSLFDPAAGAWTLQGGKQVGSSSEESWVLLPDGTVLAANCVGHPRSEKFIPRQAAWMVDGSIPAANDIVENASAETGPAVVLPDGRAFYVGATGTTALYTPPAVSTAQGTWTGGPNLPVAGTQQQGAKDGPGSLLVTGNVLFGIAPVDGVSANYLSPTTFYEFDGVNVTRTSDPPNSDHATYVGRMLLLPTGEVMFAREDDPGFYAYTDYGSPQDIWRPVINTSPGVVSPGSSFAVSGLLFNGFSQAVGYGDDSTAATNYPLVRIQNRASGHVRYCRTSNHSTVDAAGNTVTAMGIATGPSVITTQVVAPPNLELGPSDLFVVANGIQSLPRAIEVGGRGDG